MNRAFLISVLVIFIGLLIALLIFLITIILYRMFREQDRKYAMTDKNQCICTDCERAASSKMSRGTVEFARGIKMTSTARNPEEVFTNSSTPMTLSELDKQQYEQLVDIEGVVTVVAEHKTLDDGI